MASWCIMGRHYMAQGGKQDMISLLALVFFSPSRPQQRSTMGGGRFQNKCVFIKGLGGGKLLPMFSIIFSNVCLFQVIKQDEMKSARPFYLARNLERKFWSLELVCCTFYQCHVETYSTDSHQRMPNGIKDGIWNRGAHDRSHKRLCVNLQKYMTVHFFSLQEDRIKRNIHCG